MTLTRRIILAFTLIAGLAPAMAQVPSPVPALPDTERRTAYTIAASTCACAVNFALYGDSTDYANWLEVWLNGTRVNFNDATFGWTITSPTGPLGSIALPITNAVLTFNSAQTGTVQIVGARRPRRTSQFNEGGGVPTRNFNVVLSDLTAQNREIWDKTNDMTGRGLFGPPGQPNMGPLPTLALRSGALLAFDSNGNPVATAPGFGTGNVIGPAGAVSGDLACWNGTSGGLLKDCGNAVLAGSVGFTQGGTGSVQITLDQMLRNISVTPEMFGDGTPCSTTSGAGVQKAITFLGTVVGSGRVQIPNCMEPVLGQTNEIYPNIDIEGYASGTGTISSGILFTPTAQGQCALSLSAGASILSNVSVRNLKITTTDKTTYKSGLCASDGSVITLDNLYVTNFFGGFATIVTGAANSGTGEIRLTVTGAASNYGNDAFMVGGVAGTIEANQSWPGVVSGANTIDLKGSKFANAFVNSHAAFTGTIAGSALTTTGTTGTINLGAIIGGAGINGNILILSQTSGTAGGNGVYALSATASVTALSMTSDAVIIPSSTAIQLSGRELYQINNVSAVGDLPLRISPNPNVAGGIEALDESNFNNLSLGGATGTNSIVMVDTGVVQSSVKFGGTQSWGGGKNCYSWNDNSAIGISEQLSFDHVRCEQQAIAGGTMFNMQPNNTLYSLSIRDPLFARSVGILARNVGNLGITDGHWLSASGVCLDIDSTVINTQINGGFWLAGSSTANLAGQTLLMGTGINPSTGCLPSFAIYANAAVVNQLGASQFNSTIAVKGSSSGTGTITAPAALGTAAWAWPTNSGTFAVSASTPIVVNAATGNITCPTCATSGSGGYINKFHNGTMTIWQRGISSLATSTSGAYTADGWIVTQAGAAFTCAQDVGNNGTLHSLKCAGGTSNTDTTFSQRIEANDAATLAGNTVTVQVQYKQTSGSTITPKVSTCFASVADNFATCTPDLAATSITACATATWCTESYTFTASASAAQGYQLLVDCNTALSAAQACWITAADVRVTTGVATGVNAAPPPPELRTIVAELDACQRYFWSSFANGVTPVNNTTPYLAPFGGAVSTTQVQVGIAFHPMRVAPTTVTFFSSNRATPINGDWSYFNGTTDVYGNTAAADVTSSSMDAVITTSGVTFGTGVLFAGNVTLSAEQ